eukprot:5629965-Alexandrium_andersonii.AAC.1
MRHLGWEAQARNRPKRGAPAPKMSSKLAWNVWSRRMPPGGRTASRIALRLSLRALGVQSVLACAGQLD